MVHWNSSTGNQFGADCMEKPRWANTEPSIHFRETDTDPSMHFKKANMDPSMQGAEEEEAHCIDSNALPILTLVEPNQMMLGFLVNQSHSG